MIKKNLRTIKPEYRIVGSDYNNKNITGMNIRGIKLYYHDREHSWSYSDLRRKICNTII